MDVRMPDGTIVRGVPDGMPKEELLGRYQRKKLEGDSARIRQEDFDSMPWHEKMLIGAGQSVDELVTGVRGVFGGDTEQARADQALVDSVDSGWKTAGKIAGDVGMASIPGIGLSGAVAKYSVPLATRAAAGLGGEALGAGLVEGLQGESLGDAAIATATTAAVGGGLPKALGLGGSKIAQEFAERGINLTPGQRWGGAIKGMEDIMSYIPGTAGGVRKARERATESWNKFLRGGEPPHAAMQDIQTAFSVSYDDIFKGPMKLSDDLAGRWGEVMRNANKSLPEDEANKVINLLGKLSNSTRGKTSGTAVQSMHRNLGKLSTAAGRRGDGTQADLFNQAREVLVRSMPENKSNMLRVVNKDYARFKVLQDATGKVAPARRQAPGNITPNELMTSAVKGNRSGAAKGQGLLQEEAGQAADVLGGTWPSASGLAGMAADASPLLQGALIAANPGLGAAALATRGALINAPMQKALTSTAAGTLGRRIPALTAASFLDEQDPMDKMRILAEQMRKIR